MDSLPTPRARPSATQFAETFPKTPALVRHPVRCGNPCCRCARGELHESWRLVWRDAHGKQRHRYVRRDELAAVREIVMRRTGEARAARIERALAHAELRAMVRLCRDVWRELGR